MASASPGYNLESFFPKRVRTNEIYFTCGCENVLVRNPESRLFFFPSQTVVLSFQLDNLPGLGLCSCSSEVTSVGPFGVSQAPQVTVLQEQSSGVAQELD